MGNCYRNFEWPYLAFILELLYFIINKFISYEKFKDVSWEWNMANMPDDVTSKNLNGLQNIQRYFNNTKQICLKSQGV